MFKLNNKGVTLVEMVLGIVLLAIASLMLVSGFTNAARIVNKASVIKNASALASETVELQQEIITDENDENYDESLIIVKDKTMSVSLNEFNSKATLTDLTFEYKVIKNNAQTEHGALSVRGSYIVGTENSTELRYREYLPSEFNFID